MFNFLAAAKRGKIVDGVIIDVLYDDKVLLTREQVEDRFAVVSDYDFFVGALDVQDDRSDSHYNNGNLYRVDSIHIPKARQILWAVKGKDDHTYIFTAQEIAKMKFKKYFIFVADGYEARLGRDGMLTVDCQSHSLIDWERFEIQKNLFLGEDDIPSALAAVKFLRTQVPLLQGPKIKATKRRLLKAVKKR